MQDTANRANDSGFLPDLNARFSTVQQRIAYACSQSGRGISDIQLLAVSKTRSPSEMRALHSLGVAAFGENYLIEAQAKQAKLRDLALQWHFIGPIQSNKTQAIAQQFDWVQSLDREKIIRRLANQRSSEQPPLNVLIQVNIDHEAQKSGCRPDEISYLAELITCEPSLKLRGLMAIPAVGIDVQTADAFQRMRRAFDGLAEHYDSVDTLSMGMSDDLEAAIEHGSTMIRIGTALFGPRSAPNVSVS